jgi:CheY-like chemotaxis protein
LSNGAQPDIIGLLPDDLTILLAEDREDDVFLLQKAFSRANVTAQLHVVPDGSEAVAYLKGEAAYGDRTAHPFPDVLLLDLNMPRMNGFEVLEWVRKDARCSRLTVHVLTTSSREEDIRHAYDLRANSYVIKPSRMDELIAFVAALRQWHHFTAFPQPSSGQWPALPAH